MNKRDTKKAPVRYRYHPGGSRIPPRRLPRGIRAAAARVRARFRFLWGRPRFRFALQAALAVIAVAALGLSVSVLLRSARTANLNRSLAALYTESSNPVEVPVSEASFSARGSGKLQLFEMGLPDGSSIGVTAGSKGASSARTFHHVSPDLLPEMAALAGQNPDTVGWLDIGGVLSLPVVYRNNTFYLTHDFSGAQNSAGTLFLDENHPMFAGAQHLLIYGHNMSDGSMFGLLTHYRHMASLKAHPLITFSTLWEKETYAIFAVIRASDDPRDEGWLDYFSHPSFADEAAFKAFMKQLKARSMYNIPVSVEPDDALLTLATCMDGGHLLICARRLRGGETAAGMTAAVLGAR